MPGVIAKARMRHAIRRNRDAALDRRDAEARRAWLDESTTLAGLWERMTVAERLEFATRCGTTPAHLRNVRYGTRTCSPALAVHIEGETRGRVRRWTLRPGDWWQIWPELIGAEGAPATEPEAMR